MKNRIALTATITALALSGCTSTGMSTGTNGANTGADNPVGTATNVGMNIFRSAVDTQCRNELEKQNAWRVARVAMNQQQEEAARTKICGCVSEQAPQQVTVLDMANATVDSNYRKQLVTKVVAKSLQTCYASFTSPYVKL